MNEIDGSMRVALEDAFASQKSRQRSLVISSFPHPERVRFLSVADRSIVHDIERGVILLMAFWSGSSFSSLKRLKEALGENDVTGMLDVVIVDVDGSPDFCSIGDTGIVFSHGHGETIWIVGGQVIATTDNGSAAKAISVFVKAVLKDDV